jgi:parallel beta-helix repeat protein
VTTLYVDPQAEHAGKGTETDPLQTITQALAQAQSGTTIQLRPGTYTSDSGETFPLILKAGVTLRGEPASRGKGIEITGGGKFLSPSWAGQNVTIVAKDGSTVLGLTLKNENTRGSSIWVEAGSPTIATNTFIGNNREGVFVSSMATPIVRDNLFNQNQGNGVSFTRDSGGLLERNIIRDSGYGVAIGERAKPQLNNNQIIQNLDGVVIVGESRPTLRQNLIANNKRDGIVVAGDAQPVLQENVLRENQQFDVHNASSQPVKVNTGNLATLKVDGKVE